MVIVSYQCHVGPNNYLGRCLYNVMTLYQSSECDPVLSRGITLYVTPMMLREIHPTVGSTLLSPLPPSVTVRNSKLILSKVTLASFMHKNSQNYFSCIMELVRFAFNFSDSNLLQYK